MTSVPKRPMHAAKIAPRARLFGEEDVLQGEEEVTVDVALKRLCDTSDVSPDTPARAEVEGETYAVFEIDGAYFGGYVNENFVAVQTALDLTQTDIAALARNSIAASFLSDEDKAAGLDRFESFREKW